MKALGWIVAGVLAAVLVWMWWVDAGAMTYQEERAEAAQRALKAESDSLEVVIVDRDHRIATGNVRLVELRAYYDSVFNAMPSARDLYLAHREEARSRAYADMWRYMGVVAIDTTQGHP